MENANSNTVVGDSEARRRAVEQTDQSFVMEASAGTGKTHTLISRMLHLILEKGPTGAPLRLTEICAITFTEKAAGEMKVRLRQELEDRLAQSPSSELREIILRALDDLETASISTFHSFAVGLLKERPIEAGLDPHFSAMNDIQGEIFFRKIWEEWLAAALERRVPVLERALRAGFGLNRLAQLIGTLRSSWLTIRDLKCLPPPSSKEELQKEIADNLEVGKAFRLCALNQEDKLLAYLHDALNWLENLPSDAPRIESPSNRGAAKNWKEGEETVRKVRAFVKNANALRTSWEQLPQRLLLYEVTQWLCQDFLATAWEKKKTDAGYLDFDDQLYKARELLRQHRSIRTEFQEHYKTILVDEFQDTDPIQLEIVLLLTSNSDADNSALKPEPGRLFIVGDPKQSIYRFRGADIETYLRLTHEENLHTLGLECLSINRNFRSCPSILRFADAAFEDAMCRPEDGNYQSSYAAFKDEGARREELGAPSVHLLDDSLKETGDEKTKRKTDELITFESERIAKLVRGMQGAVTGMSMKVADSAESSGWRTPRYGDIAILLPVLSHADALEDALRRFNVPYVLEGGKFYYSRSEVSSAITLLSAIANPNDGVALYGALRSIFFSLSDEDLLRAHMDGLALDYRCPVPESSPLHTPFAILQELHERRHERRISETFETLLQKTGAREVLAARGRQSLANLNKISRTLRTLEEENGFSRSVELLKIIDREELSESESRLMEERSDAVRVMTIHKAKGLDFPIVIVAALGLQKKAPTKNLLANRHDRKIFAMKIGSKDDGTRTGGWEELNAEDEKREDAELVRLLYVALTRAKDHLILSTHTGKRKQLDDRDYVGPDVGGTRLEPLRAVLMRCLSADDGLARAINTKRLDEFTVPSIATLPPPVSEEGIESIERQYRELRELIENTPASGAVRAAGKKKISESSDSIETEMSAVEARRRSLRLGTAFHEVMERVDLLHRSGLKELLGEVGAKHNLNDRSSLRLREMVEKCLASELMERARAVVRSGGRLVREMPFVRPTVDGGVEEGKIDLLFEETDGWVLADYKTDRIPKDIQDVPTLQTFFRERYVDQVRAYLEALQGLSLKIGTVCLLLARTGAVIEMSE